MLKAKDDVVEGLTKGIELLFKQNVIDYIKELPPLCRRTRYFRAAQ